MPSKDEIKKEFDNWGNSIHSTDLKIYHIIILELPFDLLPIRKEPSKLKTIYKGNKNKIICSTELDVSYKNITKLPDNLVIYGDLNCSSNQLTELPKGLEVFGNLKASYNNLTEFPDDTIVHGYLDITGTKITKIPKTAVIWEAIYSDYKLNYFNPKSDEEHIL